MTGHLRAGVFAVLLVAVAAIMVGAGPPSASNSANPSAEKPDVLRMDIMESLGGMCGAMTSTAGIGAIASKTDCDLPVISYAAAYPAALVMMTIAAQMMIRLLS